MAALAAMSDVSMLEEEVERDKLEVWLVAIAALTRFKEASTLEEEFESDRLEV
jgi:hypothetical protein